MSLFTVCSYELYVCSYVHLTMKFRQVLVYSVLILVSGSGNGLLNKGSPYSCVWDSPTINCARYGFTFNLTQFDIVQNSKGSFNGENITIFYGPGEFPKIDHTTGTYTNGGIPQLGNLTLHLEQLNQDIDKLMPNKDFQGLGVLDFEAWRPLFKHNFDSLSIYQKASEDLVKKQHPSWTNTTQIKKEAERQFNIAGRQFFEATLKKVKESRPGGRWGYYGFPRCYGNHGNFCAPGSEKDNDLLDWLWTASSALYPRIYLAQDTSQTNKIFYLMATVHESVRIANQQPAGQLLVYTYSRHSYDGVPGHYYSTEDLWLSHATSSLLGGDGVVIWGSTKSMESNTLCTSLHTYTSFTLGPFVKDFTKWTTQCSQQVCSGHGQCTARDIPSELSFLTNTNKVQQKEWMDYFVRLMFHTRDKYILTEAYTCKCFPEWKGQNCQEPK